MVHSKSQFIWSSNPDQQSLRLKKKKKTPGFRNIPATVKHDKLLSSASIFWSGPLKTQ